MEQKITLKAFLSFSIMCLYVVSFGFGQSIYSNLIEGPDPSAYNPYTIGQIADDNITVFGIGRGAGINIVGFPSLNRYNANSWNATSLDLEDYFEFRITPNSGYEIDFVSFEYTSQRSDGGPPNIEIRSSHDNYSSTIETQILTASVTPSLKTVDLSGSLFQNITSLITFRVYAWGVTHGNGTLSINDFTFNGIVSDLPCASTVTWTAGGWDNGTGPTIEDEVIIDADYNTGTDPSFSACRLTVNSTGSLTVADNTFVEVQNNVTINGTLTIETSANFVQYGSRFTGTATVNKTTKEYNDATLHYVYWSSPVESANLSAIYPNPYLNRRYYFDASLYLDQYETGTGNPTPDDIDDDNNVWIKTSGLMEVGRGYAIATDNSDGPPYTNTHQFTGALNNGDITVPIFKNDSFDDDTNWNFIGNPYPSAIDASAFIFENYYDGETGTIDGPIYVWNSEGTASAENPGFETNNFSQDDYYDLMNLTGGSGGPGPAPGYILIPSGQGFFVSYHNDGESTSSNGDITEGAIYFNNVMRIADEFSNSEFYKNTNVKGKTSSDANKLWVKLTSDNGVYSQILIGYLNIATDNYDGEAFDASKNLSSGTASIHSIIPGSDKKFIIQGKAEKSLDINETIKLGFATKINVATLYTISIAHLQGEFLTNNTIYLKDNLLGKVHNLSEAEYTFSSEVGEFNDRFVLMFDNQSLSIDEQLVEANTLKIIDLDNDQVQFIASNNLTIKKVSIFDLLGRELYQFEGQNNSETYNLSNLKSTIYIAKVELSNGTIINRKAVKK